MLNKGCAMYSVLALNSPLSTLLGFIIIFASLQYFVVKCLSAFFNVILYLILYVALPLNY